MKSCSRIEDARPVIEGERFVSKEVEGLRMMGEVTVSVELLAES